MKNTFAKSKGDLRQVECNYIGRIQVGLQDHLGRKMLLTVSREARQEFCLGYLLHRVTYSAAII